MTKKTIDQRDPVDAVADIPLQGYASYHVVEYLEAQEITPQRAVEILEQALTKFVKVAKLPREVRRGWCIEALRMLFQKMVSSGDYAGARQAVSEIARLADVVPGKDYTPQNVDETKDEIDDYIDTLIHL